jgi:hypothetical protein
MNTKSALGFAFIAVIITATASILSIGTIMMIYAQETASSQENVTGTQNITGITCNEEADDKGENEEGPDEDDDEPGDIDVNDEEDAC